MVFLFLLVDFPATIGLVILLPFQLWVGLSLPFGVYIWRHSLKEKRGCYRLIQGSSCYCWWHFDYITAYHLLVQNQHYYCRRAALVQCTQNSVIFLWLTLQQDLGLPHLCKSTAQDYLQELEILSWKKGNNELFEWEFVEPERVVSLPITVSEETGRCIRSEQIGSARSSSHWEYLLWTTGLSNYSALKISKIVLPF